MVGSKPLTREDALKMQMALISEYRKPEFQAKLRIVLKDDCSKEDRVKIEGELRDLRENIGAKFGFEPSPEGVAKSVELFTPELLADPEIEYNCTKMNILLYPQLQDELTAKEKTVGVNPEQINEFPTWDNKNISLKCRAEMASKYEAKKAARKKAFVDKMEEMNKVCVVESVGRQWAVVGGSTKGILVRKGEELHSREFATRLAQNSIVEELELIGDRLHYKKLAGEGPDFGWVSLIVKGATLLRPVRDDEILQWQTPEVLLIA